MSQQQPNNMVDLDQQAAIARNQAEQQQRMWQVEQAAQQQAAQAAQQQSQLQTKQTTDQTAAQLAQNNALNAGQGQGVSATGGASGIKDANTALNYTMGLSPADMKLQAAGLAASPTSLASLMQKRAANAANIAPTGGGLLQSSSVKLGGS